VEITKTHHVLFAGLSRGGRIDGIGTAAVLA
jgi:hypothetical protein